MNPADGLIGRLVEGRFRVEGVLGSGGMGTVYLASDTILQRPVAVKVLHSQGEQQLKRFQRECRLMATVKGEHLPKIYRWGIEDGVPFIAMEFVEGDTLSSRLLNGQYLPQEVVRELAIQICDALSVIHRNGIVHRDLKPANIMLGREGKALKVMDFGIAHLLDGAQVLTKSTEVHGTLGYLSPEHFTPRELEPSSDLFSLGCILFEALTGRLPFSSNCAADMLQLHASVVPALPHDIEPYLAAALQKCLRVQKKERFQSAEEFAAVLRYKTVVTESFNAKNVRAGVRSRPVFAAGLIGLLVLALCAASMLSRQSSGNSMLLQPKPLEGKKRSLPRIGSIDFRVSKNVSDRFVREHVLQELNWMNSQSDSFWRHQPQHNWSDTFLDQGIIACQAQDRELAEAAFQAALRSARTVSAEYGRQIKFKTLMAYCGNSILDEAVLKAERVHGSGKRECDSQATC